MQTASGVHRGFTLRGCEAAEFGGTGGLDGWDGRTEYQKGPLIFFILCTHIDKIYSNLKQNKKKTQHSYGHQKFDVKLVSCFFFFNFTHVRVFLKNHIKSMDFRY